jgi:hypothetical protein
VQASLPRASTCARNRMPDLVSRTLGIGTSIRASVLLRAMLHVMYETGFSNAGSGPQRARCRSRDETRRYSRGS